MLRTFFLYFIYLKEKLRLWKRVNFRGFTVVYAFKGSGIYWGKNVLVNSHFLSNLAGMHQRSILVARDGGIIRLGDDISLSATTIYALRSVEIGNGTLRGANTVIMDNAFHPLDAVVRRTDNRDAFGRKPVCIGKD